MLKVGIVGLANVGKSTLFKALTSADIDCANFPFCTIEPNEGIVNVPDQRLDKLAKMSNSKKITKTVIKFVDIAGLIAGAHKGEGLGNKFLNHIREVDLIIHVVRGFQDNKITHIAGQINPRADKDTINTELILADLEVIAKKLDKVSGLAKTGQPEAKKELAILKDLKQKLGAGQTINQKNISPAGQTLISSLNLITTKPRITVLNINEGEPAPRFGYDLKIAIKTEADLLNANSSEQTDYRQLLKLEGWDTLDDLTALSYKKLNLISFLTTGPKETRAWTITNGTKAPQAAGKIHTDFEKNFVKAEVINWQKLITAKSWLEARNQGQIRLEGKEYVMQDGDVVDFKIGV